MLTDIVYIFIIACILLRQFILLTELKYESVSSLVGCYFESNLDSYVCNPVIKIHICSQPSGW